MRVCGTSMALLRSTVAGIMATIAGVVYAEPLGLYLTWQRDPLTTMTIDWHLWPEDAEPIGAVLEYKKLGAGEGAWQTARGSTHEYPHTHGRDDRVILRVELTGLKPGTAYRFRQQGSDWPYYFRTMPLALDEPLRFAIGGDTHYRTRFRNMNKVVMEHDPAFIVWGGDLTYADARPDRASRWHVWFDGIMRTLIAEDHRVVPIVCAIGNHEMLRSRGGNYWYSFDDYEQTDAWRRANAEFFYGLLAFPGQPGYGVLNFGDYMRLLVLDSDHSNPVEGKQTEWLRSVLENSEPVPHLFPVYHVPAYPSARNINRTNEAVLRHWVPLFEQHGVRVAFENHDHTYKRTHPIRDGKIDPDGIVYIGDGAWGVGPRNPAAPDDRWYLYKTAGENHAVIVTLDGLNRHFSVIGIDGDLIDEYADSRP